MAAMHLLNPSFNTLGINAAFVYILGTIPTAHVCDVTAVSNTSFLKKQAH